MKTRNQAISSTKTKVAPETSNDATNQPGKNEPTEASSNPSPSPPRLRERKPSIMDRKSQSTSSTVVVDQTLSSSADAKRSLIGPTRLLRRRFGSKPTSLLAPDPRNKNPSSTSGSINKSGSNAGKITESAKKDTQQCQHIAKSPTEQRNGECSVGSELEITIKPANIKDYSRDIPSIKTAILPKQVLSEDELTNGKKTKPVRISLPDSTGHKANDSSMDSLGKTNNLESFDKIKYMLNSDGLVKINNTSDPETVLSNGRNPALDTDLELLDGNGADQSFPKKIFNILICVTGSVATIKLVQLILKLKSMFPRPYTNRLNSATFEASVCFKVIMTKNSKHFMSVEELIKGLNDESIEIHDDSNEWELWKKIGDPVLHIDLRKWADLCLIAPLDANTMAKLANGICDNLLTCVVRAWDVSKPLIYCPAMNVHMFEHPITREQLSKLQSFGYTRVDCIEKRLACGDFGIGGMATVDSIANKVVESLIQPTSRSVSLTRPLLNQQPTYPIISTSNQDHDDHSSGRRISSSISTHQLLNRFRTNNQITIHAVAKNPTKQPPGSRVNEIAALALKRNRTANPGSTNNSYSTLGTSKNPDKPYNNHNLFGPSKHKMGGVTSVQNLKAIGLDESLMDFTDETGFAVNPNDNDVEIRNYFDPSRLLEQSMIIEDSIAVPQQTNSNNSNHSDDLSFPSSYQNEESLLKNSGLTPLLNTSKFLALCHNKERGCFTCAICKHDYKNRKSMARHLKEQHVQGNIYQCKPCGVSYKRREKLIKHNRERHAIY